MKTAKQTVKFRITRIQLYDYVEQVQTDAEGNFRTVHSYSANLVINDEFIVQIHGNTDECTYGGIADSSEVFWNTEENQDLAGETIDHHELKEILDDGFENNIGWLEDNADDVMNPENAQYRYEN